MGMVKAIGLQVFLSSYKCCNQISKILSKKNCFYKNNHVNVQDVFSFLYSFVKAIMVVTKILNEKDMEDSIAPAVA